MRILLTTDPFGGVWTYALELAGGLEKAGHAVVLASVGRPLTADERTAVGRTGARLLECHARLEWMDDPWDDVDRTSDWLLEVAAGFDPDVVHLNQLAPGDLPWDRPVLVVGHSCVQSWWQAVRDDLPPPPTLCEYARRVGRGLRAASRVAAPTAAMLDTLAVLYGPLPDPVVLPNGRDPRCFQPRTKEPLVLGVGRVWDEGKNLAALDRAAARIPWPVVIAGSEEDPGTGLRRPLRAARALGFVPPERLAGWFGRAGIYALPARYEPFGLSALEAAMSGCALVLGDIPSLREVWGDAAVFVPPADDAALAEAIGALIGDPERRREMARRARAQSLGFTAEGMVAGYVDAYDALLAPVGGGA